MTLRSSVEHERGAGADLGQRVRAHAEQQLLVPLARPVDPDVGHGRRGQEAAEGIEGLGPDGHAVDRLGVAVGPREARGEELAHARQPGRIGLEGPVQRGHIALAQRAGQLVGDVIAPPALGPIVVGDVAGGLLEVGHEPAPLQHLGQEIGRALAREVHSAELGDRVVAVLEEDALVQLLGATAVPGPGAATRASRPSRGTRPGRDGAATWASANSGRRARPSRPRGDSSARRRGRRGC